MIVKFFFSKTPSGVLSFSSEVLLHKLYNHTGKQEYCDQVRDRHQTVESLCDTPEKSKVNSCADDRYQRVTLIEAAKIDGASEWYIYFRIVLPLSLPILATIGLMTGLGYWNNWTNGLYFITDTRLYSLQQYLKSIIDNITALSNLDVGSADMPSICIRMAIAVVGTVP